MKQVRLAGALMIVVALGACSSSSTESSPAPSEAAATSSPVASAMAEGTTVKTADSSKGKILTSANGMSLYTFDNDAAGKSNCTDACTTTWPPLAFSGSGAPTGANNLGTITRSDGTKQVTWNGKPLYNYSGDTKAGDTNGDGIGGKWHVAKAS